MGEGALAAPAPQDLDSLAHEINRQQQLADDHFRTSVQHGLNVGRLLLQAKDGVRRGEWLTWLASNTSLSERTAQGYMQLVRRHDPRRVAGMGLREALTMIAAPANEPEPAAATTGLSERLREAGRERERHEPQRPPGERATLRDLDAAREELDRQMRRAGRRDGDDRAEAARRGATAARRVGDLLDVLAAGLAA
jgi:hypothetical protein